MTSVLNHFRERERESSKLEERASVENNRKRIAENQCQRSIEPWKRRLYHTRPEAQEPRRKRKIVRARKRSGRTDAKQCPLDTTGALSLSAQDPYKIKSLNMPACRGRSSCAPIPILGAVYSWWLLGDEESAFFKGVDGLPHRSR